MPIGQGSLWAGCGKGNDGKLKLPELEYDGARVQDVYMRNGYLDASVSEAFVRANFSDL